MSFPDDCATTYGLHRKSSCEEGKSASKSLSLNSGRDAGGTTISVSACLYHTLRSDRQVADTFRTLLLFAMVSQFDSRSFDPAALELGKGHKAQDSQNRKHCCFETQQSQVAQSWQVKQHLLLAVRTVDSTDYELYDIGDILVSIISFSHSSFSPSTYRSRYSLRA